MAKRGLTDKQELFVQEYLEHGNASQAYRVAYPTSKKWKDSSVWRQAKYTIDLPNVLARINFIKDAAARKIAQKYEVTQERLTKEYARISTDGGEAFSPAFPFKYTGKPFIISVRSKK